MTFSSSVAIFVAAAALVVATTAAPAGAGNVFDWKPPKQYTVHATMSLPYINLLEPVTVYYDAQNGRSRTDYYMGTDSYFYRADKGAHGVMFQINPVTNQTHRNVKQCFATPGDTDDPIAIQSIFPDLSLFQVVGDTTVRGIQVHHLQYQYQELNRTNTYDFYVSVFSNEPVQYHMLGYDDLLGSHYDEYVVDYLDFKDSVNASVFDLPKGISCGDFPGPGASRSRGALAMVESPAEHEKSLMAEFEEFKKSHAKRYAHHTEHTQRLHNYRHNKRYIESHNRRGLSFKLSINHLADHSDDELARMRGHHTTPNKVRQGSASQVTDLPKSVDWRDQGAVSVVKDQGICGSCWSFGSAEAIEGQYFIKTGDMLTLSQQALMDCSWGYGNNACDGGESFRAFEWVMSAGGLPSAGTYGPYMMADGYCHDEKSTEKVKLSGYQNLTSDVKVVMEAVANHGPVSVAIDASHKSFSFYSGGVYYEEACGNTENDLDHEVLLVGYGIWPNGDEYWIIKNSWSVHWGDQGYVLMSRKDNNCGVATDATLPMVSV